MDFRAMLMKRKRKEKKVVVKKIEFIEKPVDFSCQQGKCELVTFTAKLNEKDKKGKWYIRNNVSQLSIDGYCKPELEMHVLYVRRPTKMFGRPTTAWSCIGTIRQISTSGVRTRTAATSSTSRTRPSRRPAGTSSS